MSKAKAQHSIMIGHAGCIELDFHIDTIVAGSNCVVLSPNGMECGVTPYNGNYELARGFYSTNCHCLEITPYRPSIYLGPELGIVYAPPA